MDTTINILLLEILPLVTKFTWLAKTINPGSAIEIKKPKINPATRTTHILFVFASDIPVKSPNGVIPISTPNKKIVKPTITKTVPIKNLIINEVSIGDIVKLSNTTNIVIGNTEKNTSFNFDNIISKLSPLSKLTYFLKFEFLYSFN